MKRELLATNLHESDMDIFVLQELSGKIEWEEEGKEFHLDGEMYDVVKTKEQDGHTILYCLKDKKEKQLLDQLVKLVKDNRKSSRSAKLIKAQVNTYEAPDTFIQLGLTLPHNQHYCSLTTPLHSSVKEIQVPPPRA